MTYISVWCSYDFETSTRAESPLPDAAVAPAAKTAHIEVNKHPFI